ncbi:hypothetical protein AKJ44_01910 [candidate division MSBL1 archaeon SCGC-AAA261F17]|uniref:Uncharacterized protein n=1 Tax=candidate division MSBL1 archaeon SCGC-AAA261F17 TaxID=1698274 RepID=A0A133V686_9EURY|nr:hypothetical protein AKJ44_01910 [candidate division MSBL1 archaeon SCGC-AAA261F17]
MTVEAKDRLVSIKKSDLESLEATIETLQNEEVMRQLKESDQDIKEGKTRTTKKLLRELKD